MIYTVTLSPSLDYYLSLSAPLTPRVNRTVGEEMQVGGKGINVARMLHQLGMEATALGFVAGFVGEELSARRQSEGLQTDFIRLPEGCSRINVKLAGAATGEINARGPAVTAAEMEALQAQMEKPAAGDTLVLAGNPPAGMDEDVYHTLMKRVDAGVRVVVDATGKYLTSVLPLRPFLIKPNRHELAELYGKELREEEQLLSAARMLQDKGARNVLVSLDKDGAWLLAEDGTVHRGLAPRGQVVGTVGAGDSMVAGFLYGYDHFGSFGAALQMGLAAGSATAFSRFLATGADVMALYRRLTQL